MQRLILAQIEEWYQTICRTSKNKDDFNYIKDMHRLLSNKGYTFPEVKLEDAAVLNPSDNLKSVEELQKEEAIVHSAKLQELIRRGKPQDLQEANKLMKIMAGFKDESIQQSKKQVVDDVARLKRKVEILAEMLNSVQQTNGKIDESNEAMIELYSSVKSSQPIITKIIEEESGNEEQVTELLALNDDVNSVISKFQLLKAGDVDAATKIKVAGGVAAAHEELNLIDFDDDDESPAQEDAGYDDLLSDLANLKFNQTEGNQTAAASLFGSGGMISLGASQQLYQPQPTTITNSNSNPNFDLLGFSSPSPQFQSNTSNLDPFGLNFPSSTPNQIQNKSNSQTPQSTGYKSISTLNESAVMKLDVATLPSSSTSMFQGKLLLSSVQPATVSQIKFMIAVPKSCKLNLKPQSSDVLYGLAQHAISQEFSIENTLDKPLKIKWKTEYVFKGEVKEETGVSMLES